MPCVKSAFMNMRDELIKIAKQDLYTSKILHKHRLYSQAIFYFQQSVEKQSKSLGLLLGNIEEKELSKGIWHHTVKIFEKDAQKQLITYQKFKQLLDTFPMIESAGAHKQFKIKTEIKRTERLLQDFQQMKEKHNKLVFLSSEKIKQTVVELNKLKTELKQQSILKLNEKQLLELKQELLKYYSILKKLNPVRFEEIKQTINKLDIRTVTKLMHAYLAVLSLVLVTYATSLCLASITFPHSILPRYPQEELTPLKVYTRKLPIVRWLPKLIDLQKEAISGVIRLSKM